jgi:hypothetical protein
MDGVSERFRNDEGTPYLAVRPHQLREDVVVALLKQRKVQDEVALIGTLVVALSKVQLVVASVDVRLDRQVGLVGVTIL